MPSEFKKALEMVKGVLSVVAVVASPEAYWAQETARLELGMKLWATLFPEKGKEKS